ncbi:hypothetical protein Misp03_13210 [Microbispora sp. NBRC 16548]|nr:hypothetical protein Misp03_13210 [Microbispora sp. NBRC 16548]
MIECRVAEPDPDPWLRTVPRGPPSRTSRSGTGPRSCWSGCAAIGAACAGGSGGGHREGRTAVGEAVARVAAGLGVPWHTADSAVLAEGQRVLTGDEVVAMDAFIGLKTTAVEEPPGPPRRRLGFRNLTKVMFPFIRFSPSSPATPTNPFGRLLPVEKG